MPKRLLTLCAFAAVLGLFAANMDAGGEKDKKKFKPKYDNTTYVPTADEVINKMFEMAKVNQKDVIFDLGCGDNRILYMAATKFGCRGVGIETNPDRVR